MGEEEAKTPMETARENGALIIRPEGAVDSRNSRAFHAEMEEAIQEDDDAVVLDLGRVHYVSSAGLRAILLTSKALGKRGKSFSVSSLCTEVQEVFAMSGFDQIMRIYQDAEEAARNEAPGAE